MELIPAQPLLQVGLGDQNSMVNLIFSTIRWIQMVSQQREHHGLLMMIIFQDISKPVALILIASHWMVAQRKGQLGFHLPILKTNGLFLILDLKESTLLYQ